MASMSTEARDEFLSDAKIAVLSTAVPDGPPLSVPIWFEWDGERARFFTGVSSPKMRRIEADPRVSLLVANPAGEPERWVLIEGTVAISEGGGADLAERLAHRYWDMSDPGHAATVQAWKDGASSLRLLEITPSRIRSSG